jgi:hypothetical protein
MDTLLTESIVLVSFSLLSFFSEVLQELRGIPLRRRAADVSRISRSPRILPGAVGRDRPSSSSNEAGSNVKTAKFLNVEVKARTSEEISDFGAKTEFFPAARRFYFPSTSSFFGLRLFSPTLCFCYVFDQSGQTP